MNVAEQKFGIPRVMDASDLVERPDANSVMTYLTYFQHKV